MARMGWGWGLLAVAAAFAGGVAGQWLRPPPVIAAEGITPLVRARAVSIVDADGRERIRLAVEDGAPAVTVCDAQSVPRVRMTRLPLLDGDAYYGLEALDGESRRRFVCGAQESGAGAGLGIFDAKAVARVGLGATADGCGMALRNASDVEVLGFGEGGGADFTLKHPFDGRVIWRASEQIAPE